MHSNSQPADHLQNRPRSQNRTLGHPRGLPEAHSEMVGSKTKENPKLEASDLKELLSEKTVLVTCTHASNILGTIHDIKAIAEAVHKIPGVLLAVDAVAYAPHRKIDVKELGVDFYCFSWYKVLLS